MKMRAFPVLSILAVCGCLTGATADSRAKTLDEDRGRLAAAKTEDERFTLLDDAALEALQAGEIDKARAYSDELLSLAGKYRESWNYGNAIHHGHLIRGSVALAGADVETAVKELRAAGETPGSPQLDTFGPNMALAKALLERGQRDAVMSYLEQCRKFWSMEDGRLDQWKAEIARGQVPDFRANLAYW